MEFKQIQELIETINASNIGEVSIKDGDFELTIKQSSGETNYISVPHPAPMPSMPQPQVAQMSEAPASNVPAAGSSTTTTITSPMIGTFYRSSSPDKPPFINVGDDIKVGDVICIVEAMKLFNEIESEVSGRIVKVLIDDASPVEYDQPLFLVEPN